MPNRDSPVTDLALDEFGRVILPDDVLRELEADDRVTTSGGINSTFCGNTTNSSGCINSASCGGSINRTSCSNQLICNGTTNGNCAVPRELGGDVP